MPRNALDIVSTTVNKYIKIPGLISRKSGGTNHKVIQSASLHELFTEVNALKEIKIYKTGTRNSVVEGATLAGKVRRHFSKDVTFQSGQNDEKSGRNVF